MKKAFLTLFLICLLLLSVQAYADLSTNLQVKKEINPATRKVTRETYVDSKENPVAASDKGYAIVEYLYNASNLQKEVRFLDAQENLVNNAAGYASIQYEYKTNKIIKTSYLDVSGKPVMGPDGYAVQEIKRGTRGVQTETIEYDADGKLLTHSVTEYVDIAKSNLIKSVSWYDAENKPAAGPNGYARVEYEYFKRKKIKTTYFNADGGLFLYEKDGFACKEEKYIDGKVRELNYYGADGNLIAGPSGFAQAKYTYAQGGKETLTMYYNADGSPFFTNKGYCGIRQIKENRRVVDESYYAGEGIRGYCKEGYSRTTKLYTIRGQILRQCFYDDQDNLMIPSEIGYAKVQNTYNARYLMKTEYFNEKEEPAYCPDGYSVAVNTYADKVQADTVYYDVDGKTVINGAGGYARIVYQYNDERQKTGENYYDAEGNPVNVNGDSDEVRWEWKNGNIVSESYWKDGQPVNGEKGYHEVRKDYTADKKIKSEFYYDLSGKLTVSADGYAGIEKLYNSSKREMATLYYGENGGLIQAPGKEYAYVLTIPEKDRQVLKEEAEEEETEEEQPDEEVLDIETEEVNEEETVVSSTIYVEYYGTDRKLMNLSSGYAYIIRKTDARGRIIQEEYYDSEGQRAVLKYGYDEIRQYYSAGLKPDRIEYYLNGVPALYDNNYAAVERGYDRDGNISVERYFDTVFQPAPCRIGYEVIWKTYDEDKRLIKETYYDHNGQPMTSNKGVYQRIYEYNENGKVYREHYLDADDNPMICPDGYAGLERMYDDQGNSIATLYLNEDGDVILAPGKEYAYSITTPKESAEEKESGKTVYIEYYGTDRQLMNLAAGYAAVLRQTDGQGRTIREVYFDKDGSRVAQKGEYDELRQTFDEGTKPNRIEYYLNGEPVLRKDGYAAIERVYDAAGNVIAEKYYDASLQPAPCINGYEAIRKENNDNKKVIKEEYFDHEGQPMTNKKGVYQTAYEYNENGKVTKETYYDVEGQPMACSDGYAGLEKLYNSQGGTMATLYYNEAEELMLTPGKEYAYQMTIPKEEKDDVAEEDENIRAVYLEYYGTDGKLMMLSSGYAAILRRTDEKGRTVGEIYYDQDGQRTVRNNTYDEVRNIYTDDNKTPSRIEYYKDNEPVLRTEGYAAIEREYDEAGNVILEKYYDAEFKPIKRNGYEMIRREYNGDKKVVKEAYFTNAGEPMVNNKGVYETTFEYNELGKVVREAYFDTEGKPMANNNGYIMIERAYNEEGKKVSETSYTAESLE